MNRDLRVLSYCAVFIMGFVLSMFVMQDKMERRAHFDTLTCVRHYPGQYFSWRDCKEWAKIRREQGRIWRDVVQNVERLESISHLTGYRYHLNVERIGVQR